MATANKYPCPKCAGSRSIDAFSHVRGGVCFRCGGTGFIMQKSAPKKSLKFEIHFLWTDPADSNYLDGEYCHCGRIKARSRAEADTKAAERMKKNGAVSYILREVTIK